MAKEEARSSLGLTDVGLSADTISRQKGQVVATAIQYGGCVGQLD